MNIKEKALSTNYIFWKKTNKRNDDKGLLLYDNFYDIPQLCYGISKVALCIAKSKDLKPAVLMPWRGSEMTSCMCETQFQMKDRLPMIIIRHFMFLVNVFFFITPAKLLKTKHNGNNIGEYIYDAILRRFNKKTNTVFTLREKAFICLELCYYFYFKWIIEHYYIKVVVLGDRVYRYGLLFELCKNKNIVCYSPIDLNTLSIKRFASKIDYESVLLNKTLVEELCFKKDYAAEIKKYYEQRYKGSIQQHDIMTAYGSNKSISSTNEFIDKYSIDSNKKTIVIMCHVFADAPHVYLNTLYDDYWVWFVNTLDCLLGNKGINLLVKEHPSSHLFGQKGLVRSYLNERKLGHLLIAEDESTLSIIKNADAVVTCGGTIGLEMTYAGKNVVLASNPPYSGMGFTKDFASKKEYENYLKCKIQEIEALTPEQLELAQKASYVSFCCQNNSNSDLELGGEIILLNQVYNDEFFYNNIYQYTKTPLEEQNIYKVIDRFVASGKKAMFK